MAMTLVFSAFIVRNEHEYSRREMFTYALGKATDGAIGAGVGIALEHWAIEPVLKIANNPNPFFTTQQSRMLLAGLWGSIRGMTANVDHTKNERIESCSENTLEVTTIES